MSEFCEKCKKTIYVTNLGKQKLSTKNNMQWFSGKVFFKKICHTPMCGMIEKHMFLGVMANRGPMCCLRYAGSKRK